MDLARENGHGEVVACLEHALQLLVGRSSLYTISHTRHTPYQQLNCLLCVCDCVNDCVNTPQLLVAAKDGHLPVVRRIVVSEKVDFNFQNEVIFLNFITNLNKSIFLFYF